MENRHVKPYNSTISVNGSVLEFQRETTKERDRIDVGLSKVQDQYDGGLIKKGGRGVETGVMNDERNQTENQRNGLDRFKRIDEKDGD